MSALDVLIAHCIYAHFSTFTLFSHTFRIMFGFVLCMLLCTLVYMQVKAVGLGFFWHLHVVLFSIAT